MKTLFIDTHSERLDIALIIDNKIYNRVVTGNKNHSEIAIPSLLEVLDDAKIRLKDINEIVVVNGPGSFTGVRIGVTIAKTIAFSLNIKIKTITSLESSGISEIKHFDVICIRDAKGAYSALYKDGVFTDYAYRSNKDFIEYSKDYIVSENSTNDYLKILKYLKAREFATPHSVNPIYIKPIEVLK